MSDTDNNTKLPSEFIVSTVMSYWRYLHDLNHILDAFDDLIGITFLPLPSLFRRKGFYALDILGCAVVAI